MKDPSKNNQELITEIFTLKQRVRELEQTESKHRQVEEELQESEEKFRTIFDKANEGILIADAVTKTFLQGNTAICSMLGYTKEEIKTLTIYDIHPPQDIPRVIDEFKKQAKGESILVENLPVLRKDGSIFYADIIAPPAINGGVRSLVGIVRDITERKQAEQALQESENKYRSLATTVDTLVLVDRDCHYLFANENYLAGFGPKKDSVIGNKYDEFHNEDASRIFSHAVKHVLDTGKPYQDEWIGTKSARHWLRTFSPVKNADGDITAVIVASKDVHDRKLAEMALRESEDKINAILQSIPDHMSVMDKELNIVWANEPNIRVFGNDIIGKKCYHVFHNRKEPCEPSPCLTLKAFKDGGVHEHDIDVIDKTGKTIYFHCRANAASKDKDDKPITVLEVARDITERKITENSLRDSKEKYRSLASTVDSLILVDRDCRHLFANKAYLDRYGTTEDAIIGKPYGEYHSDVSSMQFTAAVKYVFETGTSCEAERMGEKSGRYWLKTFSPIKNTEGTTEAVTVAYKNITKRRLAEQALQVSAAEVRAIVDNNPIAMAIVCMDGIIEYINRKAIETFGHELTDIPDMDHWWELAYPDISYRAEVMAQWMGLVEKAIEQHSEIEKRDYLITCKNGVVKTATVFGNIIANKVFVMFDDITDRKQFEEDLRNHAEILRTLVAERTAELEMKSKNLEEMNIALNILLQKREEDKRRVEETIVTNIKSLVYPYLEKMLLDSSDAKQQQLLLSIIDSHLNELLTPLMNNLQQFNLTPKELQVAALIKDGRTTKEIAAILAVEASSINDHRLNLRKKLGLNRAVNLQSKLQALK